ncbi:hypothetical protein WL99_34330 [Burkholderia cepacia]|nr:hypothetical protein WL99_34330 [Burkholderia cepacia]
MEVYRFQVFDQDADMTMHNWFRQTGRARRKNDPQWMISIDTIEFKSISQLPGTGQQLTPAQYFAW